MGNEVHTAVINPYKYEINMTSVAKGSANWTTAHNLQKKRRLQGLFDGRVLQSDETELNLQTWRKGREIRTDE